MTVLRAQHDGADWWAYAACAGMDPDLWFPIPEVPQTGFDRGRLQLAKSICARCPVREECLVFAVLTRQLHGIWGGMTVRERGSSKRCQQMRRAAGAV